MSLAPCLLLSMPQLTDPNFARSVVLLCEHAPEGAFGLIVNRPSDTVAAKAVQLEPAPASVERSAAAARRPGRAPAWMDSHVERSARRRAPRTRVRAVSVGVAGPAAAGADHPSRAGAHTRPRRLRGLGTGPARRRAREISLAHRTGGTGLDFRNPARRRLGGGDSAPRRGTEPPADGARGALRKLRTSNFVTSNFEVLRSLSFAPARCGPRRPRRIPRTTRSRRAARAPAR